MNFFIWLLVGGLMGWVASLVMRTNVRQGPFLDIAAGVVGAMLGGWLVTPLLGPQSSINEGVYNQMSVFVSLIGAIVLIALVNLVRRRSPR
ncbi:GlsB/YeaQ/YmgE family stress response membrane protein [Comamonas sp. NLF-1-9]|uniref:GlsB/YeaQ/YmgE family stress response membrane protein n=1 Tax=Comamonas sp. NLF-1-9 TaxID=2853163 RepID=UPI001C454C8A|nr:GlsB/YeaQ/YmgE family stress response membrane protein [Comamonas sp. NLF-1-9]QXL85291.1 GlsB/YeaQ/YmgE family stress response membrane protein [Comamonas sp. NLF-1-9]